MEQNANSSYHTVFLDCDMISTTTAYGPHMIKKQITFGCLFINKLLTIPLLEAKPLSQFLHNLFCTGDNFIMCICRSKPLDTLRANECLCPDRLGLQPTVDNTPSGFPLPPLSVNNYRGLKLFYLILDTNATMNLFRYSFSCHYGVIPF
jgi:hypothetical protein